MKGIFYFLTVTILVPVEISTTFWFAAIFGTLFFCRARCVAFWLSLALDPQKAP